MKDSIIFDLDGTLWDSRHVIAEAWNEAVESIGLSPSVTVENLTPCMGLPLDEIMERLFPGNTKEKRDEILKACLTRQARLLEKKAAFSTPVLRKH